MSENATLKAERRDGTGKGVARKLRQAGRIPAVLYGRDMESVHLSLDTHDAEYLFQNISVDNTIVALEVEGEKTPYETLVREIQTHPWKSSLVHVDFLRIQAGVAVDVDIPLELVGTPVGVRDEGGVLEQVIHDLPIRCIPSKIPQVIEVDISGMHLHDVLHISDITFGEGIEVTIALDRTVCSIATPRVVEEEGADEEAEELEEGEEAPTAEGESEGDEEGGDED